MFSFIRQTFRHWARSGPRTGAQKGPVRCLECEALEDRTLLSLSSTEILVNTTKLHVQNQPAVASSSTGRSIVVWTDNKASKDSDIKAQLFDSTGHKVGKEITITGTRNNEYNPTVAMDSKGYFVVVWTIDFFGSDKDLWGARFRSDGTRIGGPFQVAWSPHAEYDPSIAMASNGSFVVSYTQQFSGSDTDVYARMFRSDNSLARTITLSNSTRIERQTNVAMSPDGRFDVVYNDKDNIVLQRFNKYGTRLATQVLAGTTRLERAPDVAMDNYGNAVVAWQVAVGSNWNVQARRVSSTGHLGSVINVQATAALETAPSVSIDPTTSKYVVAYQADTSTTKSVKVSEVTASNVIARTSTFGTRLTDASVSVRVNHSYLVIASSVGSRGTDPDGGVFEKLGQL
jgi:hypothetical protein